MPLFRKGPSAAYSSATETDSVVGAVTGIVKADGGGTISAAVADTDYQAVLTAASQAEMEAGTETAVRKMSPLRVAQAIAALAAGGGKVLQVVTDFAAKTTTTTAIPADDTIPQDSEGAEICSVSITPASASNRLLFVFGGPVRMSNLGGATYALFLDGTASALRSAVITADTDVKMVNGTHEITAGSTSARTYKLRFGPTTGTIYNYGSALDDQGGVMDLGRLQVWEIEA